MSEQLLRCAQRIPDRFTGPHAHPYMTRMSDRNRIGIQFPTERVAFYELHISIEEDRPVCVRYWSIYDCKYLKNT